MSIGSADGVIEVILKINDNTGKITETAIKTADGKLVDFSKLEDPEWWTIVNKVDRRREKIKKELQIEQEIKGHSQSEAV